MENRKKMVNLRMMTVALLFYFWLIIYSYRTTLEKNKQTVLYLVYLGLASPLAPIGPRLGSSKCPSYTSSKYLKKIYSDSLLTPFSMMVVFYIMIFTFF